ncbi:MAG: putative toxin-antitoxin system toxin component, PIN family [Actinomycetota bacterium]|nr:putative toxin-antitoxin system toxin component, PIN family [Actinomycetota bacterium]
MRFLRPKVVLDTNVLISALALISESSDQVIELARRGEIELYISKPILMEFKRVLVEKFHYSEDEANERLYLIIKIAKLVNPKERFSAIKDDESDNRILECAFAAKANFVISGDKHLKNLKEFKSITILSPSEFIRDYFSDR